MAYFIYTILASNACPGACAFLFRTIPTSSDERRCVDDAFVRICQMINDLSMKVRVQAAGLLGSLHLVSSRYLEQTLDKKVMSHLKVSTR